MDTTSGIKATRVAVFALIGLIACLGAAAPAAAQGAPVKVVQSGPPTFTWTPAQVAYKLFYDEFSKEIGRKVEVTYAATGNQGLLSLLSGEYDLGVVFLAQAVKAQAEGKDLVAVATVVDSVTAALLSRADLPEVKSPAEIKGKVVGVLALGSGHHQVGQAIAKAYGVNPEEVTFRSTGGIQGWIPAMRAKRVEMLIASEPTVSRLLQEGLARVVLDLHPPQATEKVFGGPFPTTSLLVRREYIEQHPKIVQAFVDAHLKALKWVAAHSAKDVVGVLPESLAKLPGADVVMTRVLPAISKTGEVSPRAVTTIAEWMRRVDDIPKDAKVDPAKMIDARFVRQSTVMHGSK